MSRMEKKWSSPIIYDVQLPKSLIMLYLVASTSTCLFIIGVNSVLIHALRKLKKLKSYSYLFIFYMSISDICIGVSQLALQFTIILKQPSTIDSLTIICQFTIYFLCQMSGGMIFIISVDRFVHMKYLTKYSAVMTSRTFGILVAGNILVNLCVSVSLVIASIYKFYFYYTFVAAFLYSALITVLCILYIRTYIYVKNGVAAIKTRTNKAEQSMHEIRNAEREFARCVIYIIVSMIVCYLPSVILGAVQSLLALQDALNENFRYAVLWSYIFAYFNSAMNGILVIASTTQIKNYVLNLLCRKTWQRNGTNSENFNHRT